MSLPGPRTVSTALPSRHDQDGQGSCLCVDAAEGEPPSAVPAALGTAVLFSRFSCFGPSPWDTDWCLPQEMVSTSPLALLTWFAVFGFIPVVNQVTSGRETGEENDGVFRGMVWEP